MNERMDKQKGMMEWKREEEEREKKEERADLHRAAPQR